MSLWNAVPKPKAKRKSPKRFSSIKRPRHAELVARARAQKKTPVRKTNAKRKASEFARCYGSKARVEFVKSLRCILDPSGLICHGPIENAHITTGGMGRKADARLIVPMCRKVHRIFHDEGRRTFEKCFGVNLDTEAAKTEAAWQKSQTTRTP